MLSHHGFGFDHGKYLYNGATQIPLFFVWPGQIPPGVVIDDPVQLTDIAATLFDLVGDPGFETQGASLVPLFAKGSAANTSSQRFAVSQRRYLSKKWLNKFPR